MLSTLFTLWAFAVAVPATLLSLVVIAQAAIAQVRRLTAAGRSTERRMPAEA